MVAEVYRGVGKRDEMYRYGSILLHLSHSEGFPNVVIEALAAGMLVILSDIPVHRELFNNQATFAAGPTEAILAIKEQIKLFELCPKQFYSKCDKNIEFTKKFNSGLRASRYKELILNKGQLK